MRRDGIIDHVRDRFLKASLRKIPQSFHHLFNEEAFSSTTVEKSGGVRTCFWPLKNIFFAYNGSTLQAGPSKVNSCPLQGKIQHPVLSQGNSMAPCVHNTQTTFCNAPPSQCAYNYAHPLKGHNTRYTDSASNNSLRGYLSRPWQSPLGFFDSPSGSTAPPRKCRL